MQEALRAYNLSHEDVIEHLRSALRQYADSKDSIRIRCVSAESRGAWHNAICIIDLLKTNVREKRKSSLRYPQIHLLEEWLDVSTFSSTVLNEISKGIISVDGEHVTANANTKFNEWEFLPSKNNFSLFPGHLYMDSSGTGYFFGSANV
jgi:hypothetical protein